MALQVIGAGFGRTGTLSLKTALEQVGFAPCHHMFEVIGHPEQAAGWLAAARGDAVDWDALLDGYAAQVDWPGCALWRELLDAFPEAKVVLSVRDLDRWWDSFRSTIVRALTERERPTEGPYADVAAMSWETVVVRSLGGADPTDRDAVIAAHRRHLDEVRATVPPGRLLEFRATDGWLPLCEHLGVPVPDEEYPNVNDKAMFEALFGLS